MLETVALLSMYTREAGVLDPSLMKSVSSAFLPPLLDLLADCPPSPSSSFCVSDGVSVVATRYITSATEEAASLFFSTGSTFDEYEPGAFRMNKADKRERIILIACVSLSLSPSPPFRLPASAQTSPPRMQQRTPNL